MADTKSSDTSRLRATVSISTTVGVTVPPWEAQPLFRRDAWLPVEAIHSFRNGKAGQSEFERQPILIRLFFGENKAAVDNLSLGEFNLKGIPPAPEGPDFINLKISIDKNQVLCLALKDPAAKEYRSIAFIYLSLLEPPVIVETPSQPFNFKKTMEDFVKTALGPTPRVLRVPRDGKDITHSLNLSFEEALHGVQKNIEVTRQETCPTCAGSGVQPGTEAVTCAACQGKMSVNVTRPLTVNIPAGIDSGAEVRLPGKGEAGWYGGRKGHLSIIATVDRHPFLSRLGREITIHIPVKAKFAKTGGQLQVPRVEGGSFFLLKLPPGTRDGTVLRISESKAYTYKAIIVTYRPYHLFFDPLLQDRLQAIKEALNGRELEIPA